MLHISRASAEQADFLARMLIRCLIRLTQRAIRFFPTTTQTVSARRIVASYSAKCNRFAGPEKLESVICSVASAGSSSNRKGAPSAGVGHWMGHLEVSTPALDCQDDMFSELVEVTGAWRAYVFPLHILHRRGRNAR